MGGKKLSAKDYERLGRIMESVFEGGYMSTSKVYKVNFLRGIFFGLGSVIGATIILTTLVWVLSFFTELPFVGEFAEAIRNSVDNQ